MELFGYDDEQQQLHYGGGSRSQGQNQGNQIAPGRDVRQVQNQPAQGAQPNINSAISGAPSPGMPVGGMTPFKGAQQTIGAKAPTQWTPQQQAILGNQRETLQAAGLIPSNGNTGVTGGIDALGTTAPMPAPTPYQAQGPAMGLEGFEQAKLDGGHISPKYVFAKHAQGLGVNDRDELLRRLQGDESGYFKNAAWGGNKGDILTVNGPLDPKFEGVSQFDVIRAMGEGGKGWQWSGIDPNGGASLPSSGVPAAILGTAPTVAPGNLNEEQLWQSIMKHLQGQPNLATMTKGYK